MMTLRSLLFLAFLVVTVLAYAIFILLAGRWLTRAQLRATTRSWSALVLAGLRRTCGLDYRLIGQERLPAEPCILMSNHQSAWETIALPGIIPLPQTWVLKQELMQVPFFGWALRRYRPIAIDRKAGRQAMRRLLSQGQQALEAGDSILVFPQGTRVAVGQRVPFNIGAAVLAEKSGAPVVPIAHNAGVFWKRRGLRKLPGRIDVVIGPPITTAGLSAKEINALAEASINRTLDSLPARQRRASGERVISSTD